MIRLLLLLLLATPALADEVPVKDDGVVRLEGTAEIPDALRQRLNAWQNVRWTSFRDFSADGSRMLVTTRFGEVSQVHLLEAPMGARQQLTFGLEPASEPRLQQDGSVVYTTDFGGNEQKQIVRLDPATATTTLLTDGESKHGAPLFSPDGSQMVFTSNARNGKDMDLYIGDGRDPASNRILLEVDGYWGPGDWSDDGTKLLVWHYLSSTDSELFIVDVATGKTTQLSPKNPRAAYGRALFDPSGEAVYTTTDREGEFTELFRVDLKTKKPKWTPIARDLGWNVESLERVSDGRLAFTVNEDGYATLFLYDPASGERSRVEVPKGLVRNLKAAKTAPVLGFTLTGPTRTGDAFTYDLASESLVRWTKSELGGLRADGFSEPELIRYPSFDGKQIPAFVYKPAGEGPFPVVIDIHGGPEGQSRPWFSSRTQFLVQEARVAVIVPNVRGSRGYGKTWLKLDNGFAREDSVKDIGSLLDWVAAQDDLKPDRVAVTGGSYGGYMVLAALVHFSDRLVAGVDVVGISNFVTFLENTKEYRRDLRRVEYGDERDPKMRKHLEAISPLAHVDRIDAALFVGHGANDPRVPVGEAEQVVEAVRASGKDVWYMLARNEGHGFSKKVNRDTFSLLRVLFLERHLKAD